MKIVEKYFDIVTQEETTIERDETPEEALAREANEQRIAELARVEAENQRRREELLNRLGITEEEAKLLLS